MHTLILSVWVLRYRANTAPRRGERFGQKETAVGDTANPFRLDGPTLTIEGDLDLDMQPAFHEACKELASVDAETLVLDLTGVSFVGSSFFGEVFVLNARARREEKTLIIRVAPRLLSLLELLGLPQLLEVEVVPEADEDAPAGA